MSDLNEEDEFDLGALESISSRRPVVTTKPAVGAPTPATVKPTRPAPTAQPQSIEVRVPVLPPAPAPSTADNNTIKTAILLGTAAVVVGTMLIVGVLLVRNLWPTGEDIGISIDGVAVMVLEDEARNPRKDWEPGKTGTLITVRNWADKNATKIGEDGRAYLAGDVQQKIDKLDPLWTAMRNASKLPPPTVLVLSGKRLTEFELPADDKTALSKLNAAK